MLFQIVVIGMLLVMILKAFSYVANNVKTQYGTKQFWLVWGAVASILVMVTMYTNAKLVILATLGVALPLWIVLFWVIGPHLDRNPAEKPVV